MFLYLYYVNKYSSIHLQFYKILSNILLKYAALLCIDTDLPQSFSSGE